MRLNSYHILGDTRYRIKGWLCVREQETINAIYFVTYSSYNRIYIVYCVK